MTAPIIPEPGDGGAPSRVLVLCTANRCRSPLAAALLRARLEGSDAVVTSAGYLPGGEPVPQDGVAIAATVGLDLSAHRSSQVSAAMLQDADLVLTAGREHARDAVALVPDVWPRVFTLLQAQRWFAEHARPSGVGLGEWIALEAAGRSPRELVGASTDDDIVDPYRRSRRVWRSMLQVTDRATSTIAAGVHGAHLGTQ